MVKEALVIDRDVLFSDGDFHGFIPAKQKDYASRILTNYKYHPRGEELENNHSLQQAIPYVWLINPTTKQVFVYRRANDSNYSETRLRNKWSCGLGGHIDKEDAENPIISAMMRELQEEVRIAEYPQPSIIGYLNDDKDDVGKVHFGIVAIAETTHSIEKGDDEMAECRMCSISELEELFANPDNEIERWTQISWPFVKDYLQKI